MATFNYIFYLLSMIFTGWTLATYLARDRKDPLLIVISAFMLELFLSSTALFVLVALNKATPIGITSLALFCIAGSIYIIKISNSNFSSSIASINQLILNNKLLILSFSLLLILFTSLSIVPISEEDSVGHISFLLQWIEGTSPYKFAYDYVSLWELLYIPAFLFSKSEIFFWTITLQPIVIFSLLIYYMSKNFILLNKTWSSIYALHALTFFLFWSGPSGAHTIKNDMVYGLGILCIIFVLNKKFSSKLDLIDWTIFTLGVVFSSYKYSGPPLVVALTSLTIVTLAVKKQFSWKFARNLFIVFMVAFITVGHYYVKNWIVFGNPLYPFKLFFGGNELNGYLHPAGTSIFSNLHNPKLYSSFLGVTNFKFSAGFLFPIFICSFFAISLFLVFKSILKKHFSSTTFLGTLILITFFIYFSSYWSADRYPGDLFFILRQDSLRYACAPIFLALPFSYAFIIKSLKNKKALFAINLSIITFLTIQIIKLSKHLYSAAYPYNKSIFTEFIRLSSPILPSLLAISAITLLAYFTLSKYFSKYFTSLLFFSTFTLLSLSGHIYSLNINYYPWYLRQASEFFSDVHNESILLLTRNDIGKFKTLDPAKSRTLILKFANNNKLKIIDTDPSRILDLSSSDNNPKYIFMMTVMNSRISSEEDLLPLSNIFAQKDYKLAKSSLFFAIWEKI